MFLSLSGLATRFQKRRCLFALLGVALLSANARAADIVVTTVNESGAGSLREAFTTAASGDRIVFDISGTPTITLLSDLPTVTGDISFANNNPTAVNIDRNGFAALNLAGGLVNPTVLAVNTFGAASPDADIIAAAGTTVFGNGAVTGNLVVPGTLAPGASASAGTIGTLSVTGDLSLSGAQVQLDISAAGGATSNDLINVVGTTVDVSGATLAPNFIGDQFAAGQTFLVLDASNALTGAFSNEASAFALPNNPFLQAIKNVLLPTDDFGFLIEDNGNLFTSVAIGCNQLSAAALLDDLQAGAPPAAITTLRNGSTKQVLLAYDQLSGSIYPSLIGAEINHIQNNLESVRDRVALQFLSPSGEPTWSPWVRAYGVSGNVNRDDCQTPGYRHEVGGVELGCGLSSGGALAAHTFAHLATGNLDMRGVDQHADIDSYRMGGLVEYLGQNVYFIAAGGAGTQDYRVRRSLTAFDGSSFVQSSFDGSSQFGYFELGTGYAGLWTPYVALHATHVELDSISETGDADFALLNNGGQGDSLRGILGLSVNRSGITPIGIATTRLRFGWMHENLDASETFVSQVANSGAPTGALADRGVDPGIDWGFVRMQVDMGVLLGGQFTVAYEGQFNSDSSYNALLGGTRWVF